MNVLITGGAGFLGQAVTRALLAAGDRVVVGYHTRAPEPAASERAVAVRLDVTDGVGLLRAAAAHRIDAIVHLAALLRLESESNPPEAVRVSCGGFVNVLETARVLGLRRVVWAGSGAVYGGIHDGRLIANDQPQAPLTIYAVTKTLNEHVAAQYTNGFGVDTIGYRFSLMTGPGANGGVSGRIARELVLKPARGEAGEVPFGDDTASWLWVGDAAEAVVRALRHEGRTRSRMFNLGGERLSLRAAADIVRELIPGARITLLPGKAGFDHWLDMSALEAELGFAPLTTARRQLELMVELARGNHI